MKKISVLATAALLVALASSTCFAAVNAGQNEVSIAGSYISTEPDGGETQSTTFIRGGMGHFMSDNISIGGDLTYIGSDSPSFESTTLVANVNAKFYFASKSTVVPYIGAQLGYQSTDAGSVTLDGYSYGAMAGIKFFMSENASFDGELNYNKSSLTASGGGASGTSKQADTALFFGLTYYFGK